MGRQYVAPRPSKEGAAMTDQQVDRVVEHLCEQLRLALRLKGTEAFPPNAKELGFDSARVRTVLLTGLHLAGITISNAAPKTNQEPPWA
jgi:hypothetical protein